MKSLFRTPQHALLRGISSCLGHRRLTIDTQSSHALRYVLKNRKTDEPLLVVIFSLLPKDGEAKEASETAAKTEPHTGGADDELD